MLAEFVLQVAEESYKYRVEDFESRASTYNSVYVRQHVQFPCTFSSHETQGQSLSVPMIHLHYLRKLREMVRHLSKPLAAFQYHISLLHYLFEFHV